MQCGRFLVMTALLGFVAGVCCSQEAEFLPVRGDYLGQTVPGDAPEIFAPGLVSTERRELNSVFSPDGSEFYFTIYSREEGPRAYVSRRVGDRWTRPEVAAFSVAGGVVDMSITPDGGRLYFCSHRPVVDGGPRMQGYQIWYCERSGEGWGEPVHLGSPVNDGTHQVYPTATEDGTLYFQATRPEGMGGPDVYRAALVNGSFLTPENLGDAINSEHNEGDVFIAPDESLLIVSVRGRPDSLGDGDLYISFRQGAGGWSPLVNMGPRVNSPQTDYCPMVSPDGRFFFFTSRRTGNGDVYWMDASVIEDLRPSR